MSSKVDSHALSSLSVDVHTPWPLSLMPNERRPATSTVISEAVRPKSCARSSNISSGATVDPPRWKLRNPSARGSITEKLSASVCSAVASPRPGANGTSTPDACSRPTLPARTITSARLAPCASAMGSSAPSTLASWSGLLTSQSFCGARRMRAPLAPPRISDPR